MSLQTVFKAQNYSSVIYLKIEEKKMPNENWKKRGLGWIPEYPDLRDSSIGKEEKNRFKVEERTAFFEKIAKSLFELIEKNNENIQNKDLIDELKNEIFNETIFIKVKLHKIFRLQTRPENKVPAQNSLYRHQILELKKYLSVLVVYKFLTWKDSEEDKDSSDNIVEKVWKWMRKEQYDSQTEELIRQFQAKKNIKQDGIFGLETYTTLNEKFTEEQDFWPQNDNQYEIDSNKKLTSKIRFVSVASLIPTTAIDKLLDILIEKAVEDIHKAVEDIHKKDKEDSNPPKQIKEKLYNIIFEQDFLEVIGVKKINIFKKLFHEDQFQKKWSKVFELLLKEDKEDKDKHDGDKDEEKNKNNDSKLKNIKKEVSDVFCLNIKSKNNNDELLLYQDIIEAFRHCYLIKPIVSTTIKFLCPLAQFKNKNFEELIEEGFKKFEEALLPAKKEHYNIKISDEDEQLAEENKRVAEAAIEQSLYLLENQISLLVQETPDQNEEWSKYNKSQIFLCFLIKKYLNQFKKQIEKFEGQRKKERQFNIFDKQELFEIDYREDSNSENSDSKDLELFTTLELRIPVIDYEIFKKIKSNCQDINKKQYSFLPSAVDLSFWCSPVRDQGSLKSCTAFAAISLYEYFVKKAFNKNIDASPLFLYKATRNKMNITEDVGSSIRETMKALQLYGVPPEDSWPYDEDKVNEEPPAFCYAYAQNYQSLKYFLLDYAGISKEALLFQIKAVLAAGFPCIFGFTIYNSAYNDSNEAGHIPFPDSDTDKVVGGHTVLAVGYDDLKKIPCAGHKKDSEGAFLIRNCWGEDWGVKGYGWLPYDYVLAGLTAAWWSLIKSEWFNEGDFGVAGSGGVIGVGNP